MTEANATGYTVMPEGPSRGEATAGANYKKDIVAIDIKSLSKDTGPVGRTPRDEEVLGIRADPKMNSGVGAK